MQHNSTSSFQRRESILSKVAGGQWKGMRTPERKHQQNVEQHSTRIFSLTDVSARILSALPPIYLRDDHHDKYDTVAVRLLSESIKRSETEPRSTHNLFRSFLDRTGCIAVDENHSQPFDNTCENIFQNYSGFDVLACASPITPELEKLFNQTVGANQLDKYPEFSKSNHPKAHKSKSKAMHVSSLMTPTSLGSNQPRPALSVAKNPSAEDFSKNVVSSYGFPFSKSPSSSANSSPADEINFEWTLPQADT
ncbi:hypothetical protein Y032_0051g2142 [Ancylostoma ceylanicum]|uniref:Uncharacterized protein n=1 Tax=Ancylostoma ceylanicum TaxID=53326 RepID=A0A016U812_9BILA|nr:hypothetical protein Y032_0051g2142 [Ancylostoma ceylanicum]